MQEITYESIDEFTDQLKSGIIRRKKEFLITDTEYFQVATKLSSKSRRNFEDFQSLKSEAPLRTRKLFGSKYFLKLPRDKKGVILFSFKIL